QRFMRFPPRPSPAAPAGVCRIPRCLGTGWWQGNGRLVVRDRRFLRYRFHPGPRIETAMRLLALPLLFAVALVAHAAGPAAYGEAFEDGPTVPVSEAIAHFDHYAGEPMRFSGRITEVCQNMGCWMMLEHDGQ